MRSASPLFVRALALAFGLALLAGVFAGCMTTQETAALRQARAKQILKARAIRKEKHAHEHHRPRSQKR